MIKAYLKQQYQLWQIRRWLNANGPAVAVRCMFLLNREAKRFSRGPLRNTIYELKGGMVEHLYRQGYCLATRQVWQIHYCYACDGQGGYCWKCDSAGEYRRVLLFDFVFSVGGRRYRWHQPAAQVRWPVQVNVEDWPPGEYHRRETGQEPLSDEIRRLYILTVREYLAGQGVRANVWGMITFRDIWQSWTG